MDNDEVDQQQEGAPEGEPVEPEDPRTTLKQETITDGLSLIQRTTGKSACLLFNFIIDGTSYAYSTLNMDEKEV